MHYIFFQAEISLLYTRKCTLRYLIIFHIPCTFYNYVARLPGSRVKCVSLPETNAMIANMQIFCAASKQQKQSINLKRVLFPRSIKLW